MITCPIISDNKPASSSDTERSVTLTHRESVEDELLENKSGVDISENHPLRPTAMHPPPKESVHVENMK